MLNGVTAGSANTNMAMYVGNIGGVAHQSAGTAEPVGASEKHQPDSNGYDERKAEVQKKAYEIAKRVSENGLGVSHKINSMKAKIARVNNQTRQYKAGAAAEHAKKQHSEWQESQKQISKLVSKNALTMDDIKGGMVDTVL